MHSDERRGLQVRYVAVIFDLDATLVDSQSVAAGSFADAYASMGLSGQPPVREFIGLSGVPLEDVCVTLGLPLDFASAYRSAARARSGELSIFPGVSELLTMLAERKARMGIITGKDRARTLETLQLLEIAKFFLCVVTPDDPPAPKPSAEGIYWLCRELSAPPSQTIVVGDSTLDVMAGRAADALVIGCTWGVADRHSLLEAGANLVVETVTDLNAALCKYLS